jgi:hypothetical protein
MAVRGLIWRAQVGKAKQAVLGVCVVMFWNILELLLRVFFVYGKNNIVQIPFDTHPLHPPGDGGSRALFKSCACS